MKDEQKWTNFGVETLRTIESISSISSIALLLEFQFS